MGFLSKKKEDSSKQDVIPAPAPAPEGIQIPPPGQDMDQGSESVQAQPDISNSQDMQSTDGGMGDELPELPPLDLPDLEGDELQLPDEHAFDSAPEELSSPAEEEVVPEEESVEDSQSSPMDNLDIPTDLDATEPVEEEGVAMDDSSDDFTVADEPEQPVVSESLDTISDEAPSELPEIKSRVMYDLNSPIFVEQQLYVESLGDIYHVKAEVAQIQKFVSLTQDLEDHIGDKYDSYKNTLMSLQKKVLFIEKKLFEE